MNPSVHTSTDSRAPLAETPSARRMILELQNISKSFPGVKALDHFSMSLFPVYWTIG